MRLKNKALLLGALATLAGATPVSAKLHLNPFHHKRNAADIETAAPAPQSMPEANQPSPATPDALSQYDDVGYATAGGGDGVSIAHARLPLQSFVEVTNLDTGRTILAVVRTNEVGVRALVTLSTQALSLLGGDTAAGIPVRVRRVNPPDQEKAALLAGQKAGDRLDTPAMLLAPLKRKLAGAQVTVTATPALRPAPSIAPLPVPKPRAVARPAKPATLPTTPPSAPAATPEPSGRFIVEEAGQPARSAAPSAPRMSAPKWSKPVPVAEAPSAAPAPAPAATSGYYLQIVSLSSAANAEAAARKLGAGASVVQAGQFWRVRMGPFASEAAARAKLGGLSAKGYGGVKITH